MDLIANYIAQDKDHLDLLADYCRNRISLTETELIEAYHTLEEYSESYYAWLNKEIYIAPPKRTLTELAEIAYQKFIIAEY